MCTELPDSWARVPLHEVTQPVKQVDPRKSPESAFTYLDISGIDNVANVVAESATYVGEEAPSRARQAVREGDVLFSTVRTYLRNIARVPGRFDGAVASTGFSVLRCVDGVDPSFLFHFTLSPAFLNPLGELQRGSSYPAVRDKDVREQWISLPPLNEQRRIVSKIEELFSELDAGVASLETAREQLKVYRQALLKHAFEGKLTAAWRAENADRLETADELRARIRVEREEHYALQLASWEEEVRAWEVNGKDGRRPRKPAKATVVAALSGKELSALPVLPHGWGWVKTGELFGVYVGSTPSRNKVEYWGGQIAWVSSGEVAFCRIRNTRERITTAGYESASTTIHPTGTIMLAMIGEGKTRGQAAILDIEAAHNQNTAAIRVSETDCSPEYLYQYLSYQYEITRRMGSGNNQKALNKTRVSQIAIPLCSIDEQREIASILEEQLAAVQRLEQEIEDGLRRAEALRQSILKRAFSGKLVPQDPSDEPATVLLERIRAERAAAGMGKPRKRRAQPT